MRVLLVTPFYIPAWGFGGPVRVVADLARTLRKNGHAVTIVTTDALELHKRVPVDHDVIEGTPVLYFRNITTGAAQRWNIYWPWGFRKWLQEHIHEFDIVHCHDFFTGLNVAVSDVATKAKIPYIIQPHGALIPIRQGARFTLSKRLWLLFFRRVLKRAAYVIASTEKERDEIHENNHVPLSRLTVLPNGLDVASVQKASRNDAVVHQYEIAPGEKVILYFGRLQFMKGIDISLHALGLLKDVAWKFLIVGRDNGQEGDLRSLVAQLGLQDRVKFLGEQYGENLQAIMGISDVFLFNSRSESFPIAVLQACAAGIPMVLSPECRVPEVAHSGAGIVLADNTPAMTEKALREILLDDGRRAGMRDAGQMLIREVFSLERIVSDCIQLYEKARHQA